MSLAHAILGILKTLQPMTGYDLKTVCFDQSIAHFWPADQAQIYRTLDKMAETGWVESTIEYQENRPNRKIYNITEAGRAELEHWLTTTQPISVYREPLLVQLFFADSLSNARIIDLLKKQLAAHQERIARYQAVELPPLEELHNNRVLGLQRLTLELGLSLEKARIEWLEQAIAFVRHLPE